MGNHGTSGNKSSHTESNGHSKELTEEAVTKEVGSSRLALEAASLQKGEDEKYLPIRTPRSNNICDLYGFARTFGVIEEEESAQWRYNYMWWD